MAAARILSSSPGLFFSSSFELLELILGATSLSSDLFEELLQPFCKVSDTSAWNFRQDEIPFVFESVKSLIKRAFSDEGKTQDAQCSVALSCFQTRLALKCIGGADRSEEKKEEEQKNEEFGSSDGKESRSGASSRETRALFFSYCLEIFRQALVGDRDRANLRLSPTLVGEKRGGLGLGWSWVGGRAWLDFSLFLFSCYCLTAYSRIPSSLYVHKITLS